ncbi:hypothetical protein [Thermogemmatispora sp.]|uniref:hypothetical protein n=1 Tax=Thermogemmatispora sp. TaxID=1968838 RepID=UPI0035E3FBAA
MILILRLLNPALRFLLEVAMMLALAYWGESSSQTLAFTAGAGSPSPGDGALGPSRSPQSPLPPG